MLLRNALLAFALSSTDAFTFTPSRTVAFSTHQQQLTHQTPFINSYTTLYAETPEEAEATEEPTEETPAEDAPPAAAAPDDILNSPAFLQRKIDVLESDIKAADEKIEAANAQYEANKAEWGPQLDKLRAEYANISDRLDNQSKAGESLAAKEVADKLISVMDNYDRAFQQVEATTDEEKEIEAAYKNVQALIINTLGELGVKAVETVGIEFDYEFHQAVMMRPVEGFDEGIVCEELAKGWAMEDGSLIRAAMVVVAA